MRTVSYMLTLFLYVAWELLPDVAMAAGGGKVEMLVNVADERVVSSPITLFFLDVYNTNPTMFGVWCVILTAVIGGALGLITDFLMTRTGLDLTSRKLIEH